MVALSLVFVPLTLGLSIIYYYGIERAFRVEQTSQKKALKWGVLVVTILGTSQAIATVNEAFTPEQLPIEYRRYADPDSICHGQLVGDCLQGDVDSEKEVLLLGDSHAAMLNHFFDHLGTKLGFKARIVTESGCVTIPGFDYQRIVEYAQQPFQNQIQAAGPLIKKSEIIFIAGIWGLQTKSYAFNAALEDFIRSQSSKEIIIISQVPRFKRDTRFSDFGLPTNIAREKSYQAGNIFLKNMSKRYSHVSFMNLS